MTSDLPNRIHAANTVRTVRTVQRHGESAVRARPVCPLQPSGYRPEQAVGPSNASREDNRGGNCRTPCLFRSQTCAQGERSRK